MIDSGSMAPAVPSDKVGRLSISTTRPALRLSCITRELRGEQATIRVCWLIPLSQAAIPETSPPPPDRYEHSIQLGSLASKLDSKSSLASHNLGVVVR